MFKLAIVIGWQRPVAGLLSGFSKDLFGEIFLTLKNSIVDASYLYRSDRPTTLAFVTLMGEQAIYAFYDKKRRAV